MSRESTLTARFRETIKISDSMSLWLSAALLVARNCLVIGVILALLSLFFGSLLRPALAAVKVDEELTALLSQLFFAAIPPALYLAIGFTARRVRAVHFAGTVAFSLLLAAVTFTLWNATSSALSGGQSVQGVPSLEMRFSQSSDGVVIDAIVPGSEAEQAGLQVGDVITAIRREAVNLEQLQARVREAPLGTPFRLRIQRNGEEIQVTVRSVASTAELQSSRAVEFVSGLLAAVGLTAFGLLIPLGWLPYVLLVLTLLPLLLGYTWLVVATFSQRTHGLLPVDEAGNLSGLTLSNWNFLTEVGRRGSIWAYTLNSFVIAVTMTVALLVLCSMAAYALSRMEFPGRRLFLSFTLILHGFPAVTLLIPIYLVLLNLGALPLIGAHIGFNTLGGMALVEVAFGMPFGVWLMKGFFDNISWDMERSALIDGASRWRTFWEIILPQVRPGLFAVGIFSFVAGWNTYLIPATFSVGTRVSNLPVYIQ